MAQHYVNRNKPKEDTFFKPTIRREKIANHTPKTLAKHIFFWFRSHRCTASIAIHNGEVYKIPSGKRNQDKLLTLPGYLGTYAITRKKEGVNFDILLEDICALPDFIQQQFDGRMT